MSLLEELAQQHVSACPHPFSSQRVDYAVPAGLTLHEIVEAVQPDPALREYGHIFIGDVLIPRKNWRIVRPKPGSMVSIRLLPQGGGGWRIAAIIGIAVLAIAATFLVGPAGFAILPAALAPLAGAAVMIGGTLLLNKFLPPPTPAISKDYGRSSSTYSIIGSRNRADMWGKLPFLFGYMRTVPPYGALPYRELIGGQIYWRAMFAVGHGPIQFGEIRIGNTNITEYQGVEWEMRRGYWYFQWQGYWDASTGVFPSTTTFGDMWTCNVAGTTGGNAWVVGQSITYNGIASYTNIVAWDVDQEKPLRLYGADVYEDALAASVVQATPVVRTSQPNSDLLTVDLVFDRGLVHLQNNPPGKPSTIGIALRIEQRPVGVGSYAVVLETSIYGSQTDPMFWAWRWETSKYGPPDANRQYDVRVTRLSPDFNEQRDFGSFSWYALKSETWGALPLLSGVCYIAMRVKASGQLSGTLDEVNVIAAAQARDYDVGTDSWIWRITSSPAAAFRHVLQHPSRQIPAIDAQIDLNRLKYWDSLTRPTGRGFNGVYDQKTSLWQVLTDIARVGRAVPMLRDLIFSVAIDEPKTAPVRLFTPRNSWGYSGEFDHTTIPHAYRISFLDSSNDYVTDETIVYDDGYNASNATRIDRIDWVGITDADQAWKEGRFHIAQLRLRREIHKLSCDFEHLACERGDLVAVQHDAISVGLGSARVKSLTTVGGNVTVVTIDSAITMTVGTNYGIRARRIVSGAQRTDLYQIVTEAGEQTALTLSSPVAIADAPAVGDLVAFGIYDLETLRLIVRDIIPKNDLSAELTLIAEAPGVHQAEFGTIPDWDPRITSPFPAPTVIGIQSDASVMLVTASRMLIARVVFTITPSPVAGATHSVEMRLTGTDGEWREATIQESTPSIIKITGVESGLVYDFRITRRHRDYLSSPSTQVNGYRVIGRADPPQALQELSVVAVGGQALLRWKLPIDLDVQVGGWILFRYSPALIGATWGNSTSIGRAVSGDQTSVYLPLKAGTYMARVFDADGMQSDVAYVSTKQSSVLTFVTEATITENPTFAGTKFQCEVVSNMLQLTAGDFDAVPDVDVLPDWDLAGSYVVGSGTYHFANSMNFGSVKKVRLTLHLLMQAVNLVDQIDSDELWDSTEDVDGTDNAPVDAEVFGKITDDDPGGSPTWSDFIRMDSFDAECRAVGQLECRMTTTDPTFNIQVTELGLLAERL